MTLEIRIKNLVEMNRKIKENSERFITNSQRISSRLHDLSGM